MLEKYSNLTHDEKVLFIFNTPSVSEYNIPLDTVKYFVSVFNDKFIIDYFIR